MKVGQAYDSVRQQLMATEAVVADEEKNPGATEYKGSTYAFESLYELRKKTETESSLTAKIGEFGLSTDVTTKHTNSIDQTRVYYLSQVLYVDYAMLQKGLPRLSDRAKNILGISAGPSAATYFATAESELKLAEMVLEKAKENVATIEAKLEGPAADVLELLNAFREAKTVYEGAKGEVERLNGLAETAWVAWAGAKEAAESLEAGQADHEGVEALEEAAEARRLGLAEAQRGFNTIEGVFKKAQRAYYSIPEVIKLRHALANAKKTVKGAEEKFTAAGTALTEARAGRKKAQVDDLPKERVARLKSEYDLLANKFLASEKELVKLKETLSGAKGKFDASKTLLEEKEVLVKSKKIISDKLKSDTAATSLERAEGEKALAGAEKAAAEASFKEAEASFKEAELSLKMIKASRNAKQAELTTAEKVLAAKVGDAQLREFYRYFGDQYVVKVDKGREFLALSTMSREGFEKSSAVGVDAGLSFANVAELKVKVNREKRETQRRFSFSSTIRARGLVDEIPTSANSFDELEEAIEKYYHASKKKEPASLKFEAVAYDLVFREAGIPEGTVQRFSEKSARAKKVISQMLRRRELAVKGLLTESFYKSTIKVLSGGNAPDNKITQNPHNRELNYLYRELKGVIAFLNTQIKRVEADIFDDDLIAPLEEKTAKGGEVGKSIQTMIDSLKQRANKGLIYVEQHTIKYRGADYKYNIPFFMWQYQYASDRFTFPLPVGASYLYLSAYDGAPKLQDPILDHAEDWQTASVHAAWVSPDVTPATTKAKTVLGWPAKAKEFRLTLSEGCVGADKECLQAREGHREYRLPQGFDGSRKHLLYAKKGAFVDAVPTDADVAAAAPDAPAPAPPGLPYVCTIQIYAGRPRVELDLDLDLKATNQAVEGLFKERLAYRQPPITRTYCLGCWPFFSAGGGCWPFFSPRRRAQGALPAAQPPAVMTRL